MANQKDVKRMFEYARLFEMVLELQNRLNGAIHPVQNVTLENKDTYLFYDEEAEEVGIIDGAAVSKFPLVKEIVVDGDDFDVVHYDSDIFEVRLCVEFASEVQVVDYYITVTSKFDPTDMIVITRDHWYVCD